MSTPANPMQAQTPPDPTQGLMQQAQQSMNNPMGQAVPQDGGMGALMNHPVIQKILQGLGQIASSYGWTGQTPQERLERTQMDQQKAETMARLAQTGAYQQGEIENRQNLATIAQQNADTRQKGEASQEEQRKTMADIAQQKADLLSEANDWKKDLAQGKVAQAKQRIDNQASQFEQTFQLRAKQVGIEQAKLELAAQGMEIKKGFLDLAGSALSQKGTQDGLQTLQQLTNIEYEHPILSQILGVDDIKSRVNQAQGAGIPGTTPGAAPAVGGPTSVVPAPPAQNKLQAKQNQKSTPKTNPGVTHVWTPNGIQPVGGPQ